MAAGRKFLKGNKLEVVAKITDILNKSDYRTASMTDDYTVNTIRYVLGRYWSVEVSYRF